MITPLGHVQFAVVDHSVVQYSIVFHEDLAADTAPGPFHMGPMIAIGL